ncbi:MAG TPA: polysaccharide deacetylase family protein [Candidatus Acidoferrum sp.]|nr:polysaccharide deacetylase family protein [Candidatus Acidoferrum sp.]
MKNIRVLIISNARPSRSWNFVNRIRHEVPGVQVCGVIQRSLRSIPAIQRQIARGEMLVSSGWTSKVRSVLHSILQGLVESLLWFVHGCPIGLGDRGTFTMNRLTKGCARAAWPLVFMKEENIAKVLRALSFDRVDLVILLGDFPSVEDMRVELHCDCILACRHRVNHDPTGPKSGALICLEHFARSPKPPYTIASVTLPWQPSDGLIGFTLKTDLIADDLLLQSVASMLAENSSNPSKAAQLWADRILGPCLAQLTKDAEPIPQERAPSKPCRPSWKLCLDVALLCSPWVVLRNVYRRLRSRYPVLILAHHLVSDRRHRMAISTEDFLRQVRYLQKYYRIVSLSEATQLLRSGKVRVPTVALTFDDGYADNFLSLRAVASEAGISATLFITTHPVDTHQEFEHDAANGVTGFLPLTWDQIQYWSTRGAEFGSHTRTHMDCNTQDRSKLQAEILGSKEDLEAQLGKPVHLFAFPYGQHENMSPEAMHLAASVYSHFVSSFGGEASSGNKGPSSHLFRKNLYTSQWELELELQSVFDFVGAIRRALRRIRKGAAGAEVTLPMAPSLSASISAAPNEALGDQRTFQQAPEKASYGSSLH